MDIVDVLLQLVILGTFVVFGIAVWLLKKEKQKSDAKQDQQRDSDDST